MVCTEITFRSLIGLLHWNFKNHWNNLVQIYLNPKCVKTLSEKCCQNFTVTINILKSMLWANLLKVCKKTIVIVFYIKFRKRWPTQSKQLKEKSLYSHNKLGLRPSSQTRIIMNFCMFATKIVAEVTST